MDEVDGTALQLTPREARPTSRSEVRETERLDDDQPERRACETSPMLHRSSWTLSERSTKSTMRLAHTNQLQAGLISGRTAQDGERTLTQEDNYSKVFLMRMPIMVRSIAQMGSNDCE